MVTMGKINILDEWGKEKKVKHVDGKYIYHTENVCNSLVRTLDLMDRDRYPNIQKALWDSPDQNKIDRSRTSCFRY